MAVLYLQTLLHILRKFKGLSPHLLPLKSLENDRFFDDFGGRKVNYLAQICLKELLTYFHLTVKNILL